MSFSASPTRRVRTVLLVVAVALTGGGLAGLRVVKPLPSAEDVFGLAQDFVAEHRTAHFEGVMTTTFAPDPDDEEADEPEEPETGRMSGDFDTKVGSRTLAIASDGVNETIVVGKAIYYRWAEDEAGLENELFAKESLEDDEFGVLAGAMEVSSGLSPTGDGLTELFELAAEPALVSHDGDASVIRVKLDPQKLFGLMGKKLKFSMTLTLTVGDGGELRKIHTAGSVMGSGIDSTVNYTDWGKPVAIAAPDASRIDPTPDVEEADLQAFTAAPLYLPASLPEGWEVTWGEVLSAEDSGDDCEQVELDFEDPDSDEDRYVYLYEMPTSCAPALEDDMVPFRAGSYVGGVSTDEDDYTWVQIKIDDKTTIQADTTLPPAEIATLLATLKPLTFPLPAGDA